MTTKEELLSLKDVVVSVNNGNELRPILKKLNLTINAGDFITILGTNGAGKTTLFNTIAGNLHPTSGQVLLRGQNIAQQNEEQRASFLARVFQDPKMGTAPRMTVAENLLLATQRGQRRGLRLRKLRQNRDRFREMCAEMGNGLENHLDTPTGNLSGGQRQALSLLMATLTSPDILLLDEHTAALDPKTSEQLMQYTMERINQNHLTCLMITHHLEDALKYGNRLVVIDDGRIEADYDAKQKQTMTREKLYDFFDETIG
ncbi:MULTISPECIES: ABC transporter ATP-binding protein [Loigolactobacillus]|uniref:ABC transporter ATP-binding protein n=1 Tax=Loigolactobacillus backii TaxID=375175 RepID=A0A192GYY7_9LACO|nr:MULTISPECIES: ATP-binding cassette domain-containing protein [Loigolactobacillus]ANK59029.1 ABC transporter ATP-binding protein [Loigolactobacillus backii]ANK61300.1 ABC transporter ATP-binding protein [Loigolactobacillus backii]ANK64017.1 ABC transporter ATP-binding protein [Loigolactobacillus backii]ANK66466.1 ABC transporter ATP-binding protein [Loigolactobacillus backii]ANK69500.1 ABC transporter ATP-binding protein [Loigolactobacillus backii]